MRQTSHETPPEHRRLPHLVIGLLLALWQINARADFDEKSLVTALQYLSLWPASVLLALAFARSGRKLVWAALAGVGMPFAWVVVHHTQSSLGRAYGWPTAETLIYPILVGALLAALVVSRIRRADTLPETLQRAKAATDLLVLLLVSPALGALPGEPWMRDLLVPGWFQPSGVKAWHGTVTIGLSLLAAYALWRRQRWGWWLALGLVAVRSLALLESLRLFVGRSFTGYDHSGGAATVIALFGLAGYAVLAVVYAGALVMLMRPALLGGFFAPNEAPRSWFIKGPV